MIEAGPGSADRADDAAGPGSTHTPVPVNVLRIDDVMGSAFLRKTLSGTGV